MPTYEYLCASCGDRYDKREGFDAPAKQKCRTCGKSAAQRVLHAPPVVFKGNGFYKTDSRGTSAASAGSTPAAPAADAGHSHGPGGHSHDTPAAPDAASSSDTPTETAAAG